MHQLWTALRHMLRAVSADRDLARSLAVESRHKENACVEGMQDATQQLRLENDELTRMTDTLHQRLLIRQAEIEVQKSKVAEVRCSQGAGLSSRCAMANQARRECCCTLFFQPVTFKLARLSLPYTASIATWRPGRRKTRATAAADRRLQRQPCSDAEAERGTHCPFRTCSG